MFFFSFFIQQILIKKKKYYSKVSSRNLNTYKEKKRQDENDKFPAPKKWKQDEEIEQILE